MGQNQTQRAVVAGVDDSVCGLQAVRWAAAEALQRQLPLRLVAAHAWPSGGLVGDPGLGVDYRAVLRDVVLGNLATAATDARQVAPELDIEQVEVTG
jgi:universal stress protein family protein